MTSTTPTKAATVVCAVLLTSCLGTSGPRFDALSWPPLDAVESVRVRVEVLAELDGGDRILDLLALPAGEVLMAGRFGSYRLGDAGVALEQRLESQSEHFPVRFAGSDPLRLVGYEIESRQIVAYSGSGSPRFRLRGAAASSAFEIADVDGRDGPEILLRRWRQPRILEIWDLEGTHLGTIASRHVLTAFDAADFEDDGSPEVVLYEYPVRRGVGSFRVLRDDGAEVCQWQSEEVVGDFAITEWPAAGRPAIVTNPGDSFLVTDRCGETLARLAVPNASWFRSLRAAWVDERWFVVAATGSGYRPYHLLAVFDAAGAPVYRRAGEGRAHALLTRPGGFLLAVDRVLRAYSLGEGPAGR